MACPLCFTAAVMETSHTQSPFSPPGPTNMQDGNRTQIFHQGPLLVCLIMGLAPSGFLWGWVLYRKILYVFHTHKHTQRPAVTADEKMFSHRAAPHCFILLNKPVLPSHNQEERRPETRTWLTVFSVTTKGVISCAQPFPGSRLSTLLVCSSSHHMNAICRRLL